MGDLVPNRFLCVRSSNMDVPVPWPSDKVDLRCNLLIAKGKMFTPLGPVKSKLGESLAPPASGSSYLSRLFAAQLFFAHLFVGFFEPASGISRTGPHGFSLFFSVSFYGSNASISQLTPIHIRAFICDVDPNLGSMVDLSFGHSTASAFDSFTNDGSV
jgi:hypothetical protein